MTVNNPKLDLVDDDVHTKFGRILPIRSQDIERKRNSDVNKGPLLRQNFAKNDGQQSQARSCQCLMYIQNLMRFCKLVLKILSGNEILTE